MLDTPLRLIKRGKKPRYDWVLPGDQSKYTKSFKAVIGSVTASAKVRWKHVTAPKRVGYQPPRGDSPTECVVQRMDQDWAMCLAEVAGSWLHVQLPADVLRSHGLSEGLRFFWWISEDGIVRTQDVDTGVSRDATLPPEKEKERLALQAELEAKIRSGNTWHEYEGDSV